MISSQRLHFLDRMNASQSIIVILAWIGHLSGYRDVFSTKKPTPMTPVAHNYKDSRVIDNDERLVTSCMS
jgi:hypothetical protein